MTYDYTDDLHDIDIGERSFLFYLCDGLRAAPNKAPALLRIAARNDYPTTDAYKRVIAHLMTVPLDRIAAEERKLHVALV
jgi:hypothetical protein